MSQIDPVTWLVLSYVVGWVSSIAWPFLLVYVTKGDKFDWRKVAGRILFGLFGLIGLLAEPNMIANIGAMSYLGALAAGFGLSSFGNNIRRTNNARKRDKNAPAKE